MKHILIDDRMHPDDRREMAGSRMPDLSVLARRRAPAAGGRARARG
jgi:hypothetical protein